MFVFACFLLLVLEAKCAPTELNTEAFSEETSHFEEEEPSQNIILEDKPQTQTEKNQVQEWFENLGINASLGAQNAMNNFKDFITQLSKNANSGSENLPTMYMGSFQLLKMPVPQFTNVIKGMADLATLSQNFNKVAGGSGLPLISQG